MSDPVLKAFEEAFGVWTTNGNFKHKPTQHQLDGFRKGHAIAEQASADRIAQLETDLATIKQQFINYENADAYALDMMMEYERLQALIMAIKEQQ